jgi:hypothetical protein
MKYTNKHNGHGGDVQLFSIDKLPVNAKRIPQKPIALGESHDHAHIVTGDCELFEESGELYVKTGKGKSWLQHTFESLIKQETYNSQEPVEVADHTPVELMPETIYKIGIQQKYNPYEKIWTEVVD